MAFDYKTAPGSNLDDTATRLWSINENRSAINRGIVTDVTGPNTGGVPGFAPTEGREISDIYHRSKITGFALDPIRDTSQTEYYVACRAGGLCSTIEVIRRDNSHTIARIYPGCEPIGIAIDPLGRSLWILANRGPDSTPGLLERRLDASTPVARLRSASGPTKTIRELNIRGRPVAIAATENSVWVLSNVMVLENGEPSEHAFVSEFVIGSGP